jgi:tetratricopeptide (TPR) repeat protein
VPYPLYKVFISSTFLDLAPERRQVAQSVHDLNASLAALGIALLPIDLERGADTRPPLDVCLSEVRQSDILVAIIGKCYGSISSSGSSITEMEFDEAAKCSLQRLAYYKHDSATILRDHADTDPEKIRKLQSFRSKIDSQLKRDTFSNADELRGHLIRDLMKWVLAQAQVAKRIPASIAASALSGSKALIEALASAKWQEAAQQLSSREVKLDMQRFGLKNLYLSLLRDLLELGSFAPPTRVTEPAQRARLLLIYIEEAGDSFSGRVALEQAAALEDQIRDPHYSFEVAAARTKTILISSNRYELALPDLKKMLRRAPAALDLHLVAQSKCTVGLYYSFKGDHARALKWYWKTITVLCWMPEICPFCLCDAFIAAGNEHMALGQCVLANDRLGKGLMIALMIPNRGRQSKALHCLARHLAWHNEVRAGIAAYVWLSRVCKEVDPSSEDADLGLLLGELVVKHGHAVVEKHLREVEGQAEQVVKEALAPYGLESFTRSLQLKPSPAGDRPCDGAMKG